MFHLAWMRGRSVLAGVSWRIYAGYNSVPCGMGERTVSCMPKNAPNAPGVGHLQLPPQALVRGNDNIGGD